MIAAGLPKWLWGFALYYNVYVYNRTMKSALDGLSPFEKRFGQLADLSNLHPWGAHVYITQESTGKLDARAVEGRWLGFDSGSNGQWVYITANKKVMLERNIKFSSRTQLIEG